MTNINLLPWRAECRSKGVRRFSIYLFLGGLIVAVIIFYMDYYMAHCIEYQTQRNQNLEQKIANLRKNSLEISDLKRRRKLLAHKIKKVNHLLWARNIPLRFLHELAIMIPNGISVNCIERHFNHVMLAGTAASNHAISQLLRNLSASQLILKSDLPEINRSLKSQPGREFKLDLILT
jgi:type IV pilus assembly protein PilN